MFQIVIELIFCFYNDVLPDRPRAQGIKLDVKPQTKVRKNQYTILHPHPSEYVPTKALKTLCNQHTHRMKWLAQIGVQEQSRTGIVNPSV